MAAGSSDQTWVVPLQSDGEAILWLVVFFVVGLFLVYKGFRTYRTEQLIRDTPTSKIRSMAVGRVELEGVAKQAEQIFDRPFSSGQCLYATWEIEEYHHDDDGSNWHTVDSGTLVCPFRLEDDTGSVVVRADTDTNFDLSDAHQHRFTVGGSEQAPERVRRFLQDHSSVDVQDGDGLIGMLTSDRRRYTETVLPPEETVYVFGSATPKPVGSSSADEALFVGKDEMSGRFIVSDRSAKQLASHYSKWAPIMMIGGVALSAVCLYFLLVYAGL